MGRATKGGKDCDISAPCSNKDQQKKRRFNIQASLETHDVPSLSRGWVLMPIQAYFRDQYELNTDPFTGVAGVYTYPKTVREDAPPCNAAVQPHVN